jgi:hypothetical protein
MWHGRRSGLPIQRNLLALPRAFSGLADAVFVRLRHRPERNDLDD